MMENRLTNTVDWLSGDGIFTLMASNNSLPWADNPTPIDLDYDYYGNHSGNKITSCLVDKLSDENGKLSTENMEKLARIIFSKYHENWERAWYALSLEYNPIHNYDGDETVTTERTYENTNNNTLTNTKTHNLSVDNTGTITDSDTLTRTGTDTTSSKNREEKNGTDTLEKTGTDKVKNITVNTKNGTEEISKSGKEATNNSKNGSIVETTEIAGYNSSSYSDDNKKTTSYNNYTEPSELTFTNRKDTTSYDLTENVDDDSTTTHNTVDATKYNTSIDTTNNETVTHNTTDTENKTTTNNLKEETTGTISDSGTNNNQENGSESTTVTTKKGGNLGVTTTQQMLQSEFEFRAMYNFFNDIVYKNIDEVLTIKVY